MELRGDADGGFGGKLVARSKGGMLLPVIKFARQEQKSRVVNFTEAAIQPHVVGMHNI